MTAHDNRNDKDKGCARAKKVLGYGVQCTKTCPFKICLEEMTDKDYQLFRFRESNLERNNEIIQEVNSGINAEVVGQKHNLTVGSVYRIVRKS